MKTKTLVTCDEFEAMAPQLGPAELIDGEVRLLSPSSEDHGYVEAAITSTLRVFVRQQRIGRVVCGETGMHVNTAAQRTRGSDVAFISYNRRPRGPRSRKFLRVPPELVAEVRLDTPWDEVEEKVRDYHHFGVDVVWVADLETQTVRVYPLRGAMKVISAGGELDGGAILPGFRVNISEFFDED